MQKLLIAQMLLGWLLLRRNYPPLGIRYQDIVCSFDSGTKEIKAEVTNAEGGDNINLLTSKLQVNKTKENPL